ncbi:MAG: YcgN family cysteine cluster protein [Pseudomonadota bacterium]
MGNKKASLRALYTADLIKSQFWESKSLDQLNSSEWEAVCDGCGKCCLHKFIDDEDIGDDMAPSTAPVDETELYYSNIACYLFDEDACSCSNYKQRSALVPDCVTLSPDNIQDVYFMPPSCSYKRLQEGRGLASWHPLLNNGRKIKMHKVDISARGKTVSEKDVNLRDFEDYIVLWPLNDRD